MHKISVVKLGFLLALLPIAMGAQGGCDLLSVLFPQTNVIVPVEVTVTGPAATVTESPVNFTATFDKAVEGLTASGVAVSGTAGPAVVAVSGGPTVWTIQVSLAQAGSATVSVKAGAATASDGGTNLVSNVASVTYAPPVPAPAVEISVGTPSVAVTNHGPVTFTVTYVNAETIDLAAGDVQVVASGFAGGSVTGVAAGSSASQKVVTVSGLVGDGTVSIRVPGSTAVNADGVAGTEDATSTAVVVDNTAPAVVFGAPDKNVTKDGPVSFAIATDADATLDLTKVSLVCTGTVTGTLDISTAGTVVVKNLTGTGTVGLIAGAGAATDAAGNTSGLGVTPSALVTVDKIAPIATIVRADVTDPWRTSTVNFNVTLQAGKAIASITNVTIGGPAFSVPTKATYTATALTVDNLTWQIAVSGMDTTVAAGGSAINVQIPTGGVTDSVGNVSTAASALYAPTNGWTAAPTVAITTPANPSPTAADPVVFHIVYSEGMTGTLAASELHIGGTTNADTVTVVPAAAQVNVTTWDVSVSKSGGSLTNGTVTLTLDAGALVTNAGAVASPGAVSPTVTRDAAKPGVSVALASGQAAYIDGSAKVINFAVTFTKDMDASAGANGATNTAKYALTDTSNANFPGGTIAITGSSLKAFNYRATIVGPFNGDGVLTLTVPAGGIKDSSGNNTNTASTTPATKITVYGAAAAVASANIVSGTKNTVDVTFNHDMTKASVENVAVYGVNGGVTITSATQQADLKVVRVVTNAADLAGKLLTVVNATDMAGNAMAGVYTSGALDFVAPKVVGVHRTSSTSINLTFDLPLKASTVVAAGFSGLLADGVTPNDPTAAVLDATGKIVTLTVPVAGGIGNDNGSVSVKNTVKSIDDKASAGQLVKLYLADGITFTEVDAKTVTIDFGTMYDKIDAATVLASAFIVDPDGAGALPPVIIDSATLDTTGKVVTLVVNSDCSPAAAGRATVVAGGVKTVDGVAVKANVVSAALP